MIPDFDVRRRLEDGERIGFRFAATAFFVILLGLLLAVSFAASSIGVAVLASLAAGTMIKIVLPNEQFRDWAGTYWSGEAGDRWRKRFHGVTSWIDRRLP